MLSGNRRKRAAGAGLREDGSRARGQRVGLMISVSAACSSRCRLTIQSAAQRAGSGRAPRFPTHAGDFRAHMRGWGWRSTPRGRRGIDGQSFTPFQGFGAPSDAASPLPCLTGKIRSPYSTWHGRGAQKRERLQQADHRVRDSLQALLHGGGGVCGVNRALIVTLEQKNAQIGARLARESGRRAARAHDALGQGVITSGRNPASAAAWSRHASV